MPRNLFIGFIHKVQSATGIQRWPESLSDSDSDSAPVPKFLNPGLAVL